MEREYFENLLGGVWEVRNVQILKANTAFAVNLLCLLCFPPFDLQHFHLFWHNFWNTFWQNV